MLNSLQLKMPLSNIPLLGNALFWIYIKCFKFVLIDVKINDYINEISLRITNDRVCFSFHCALWSNVKSLSKIKTKEDSIHLGG